MERRVAYAAGRPGLRRWRHSRGVSPSRECARSQPTLVVYAYHHAARTRPCACHALLPHTLPTLSSHAARTRPPARATPSPRTRSRPPPTTLSSVQKELEARVDAEVRRRLAERAAKAAAAGAAAGTVDIAAGTVAK